VQFVVKCAHLHLKLLITEAQFTLCTLIACAVSRFLFFVFISVRLLVTLKSYRQLGHGYSDTEKVPDDSVNWV